MNKAELITKVAKDTGMTKKVVGEVISTTISSIIDTVVEGEEVNLMGFATFKTTSVGDRNGVNPATGEKIVIPAHDKLTIKGAGSFKDAVKNRK